MDAKTLCLGVLMMGDASGYEIRKMFEDGPFAYFQDVGFGSIYPALSKLSDEGLIETVAAAGEGHPEKKVYTVTAGGRESFRQSLARAPMRDKIRSDTTFMLFFAEFLDPDHLAEIYDDYLAYYRDRVAFIETLDPEGNSEGRLFIRGLGLTFYRAVVEYMTENRDRIVTRRADSADAAE
jgi:DNA-binding PadR family transcriptional regulator